MGRKLSARQALERQATRANETKVRHLSKDEINKVLSHQDESFAWFQRVLNECHLTEWLDSSHYLCNWQDRVLIKDSGVNKLQRVREVVYNPKGKQDSTQPWFSRGYTPSHAKAFNRKMRLLVPEWAKAHDEDISDGISRPTNTGMIGRRKGEYFLNKGGDNMVKARKNTQHTVREARANYAIDQLCNLILQLNDGNKITFSKWDVAKWREQMKSAIKSSTPGYPFNGYDWEDMIDGTPVFEHVLRESHSAAEGGYKAEEGGFLFAMGQRNTGDRGNAYGDDCLEGAARLTLEAPSGEKGIGHEIAYPFKHSLLRHSPLSGQHGIRAVSKNVKLLNQGKIQGEWSTSRPKAYFHKDVSGWDGANTLPSIWPIISRVMDRVLDLEDDYTSCIWDYYSKSLNDSWMITPMGLLKVVELPSGSSVTTLLAYLMQYIYKFEIDYEFMRKLGRSPFVSTGYMGDDMLLALDSWEPWYYDLIKSVYTDHNCVFKGGDSDAVSLVGEGQAAVYLSERIYLDDDRPNFRSLKWQFFWHERPGEGNNGVKPDRMLLEEIEQNVAHPSSRELHMASLLSKLDSLLPYDHETKTYELEKWEDATRRWFALCKEMYKNNQRKSFPLRSWIGERVMPHSPTRKLWKTFEEKEGILEPTAAAKAVDREECDWILGKQLGTMYAVMAYLNTEAASARPSLRELVKEGRRNRKALRKAKSALKEVASNVGDPGQDAVLLREILIKSMDEHFIAVGNELREISQNSVTTTADEATIYENSEDLVANEGEPMFPSTIARDMLAYNLANPQQLHERFIRVLYNVRSSPEWSTLNKEARDWIELTYKELYSGDLTEDVNASYQSSLDADLKNKAESMGLEEATGWYNDQLALWEDIMNQ